MDAGGPAEATYYFPIEVMPERTPNATGSLSRGVSSSRPRSTSSSTFTGTRGTNSRPLINTGWAQSSRPLFAQFHQCHRANRPVLIAPTMARARQQRQHGMGIFANPGAVDGFLRGGGQVDRHGMSPSMRTGKVARGRQHRPRRPFRGREGSLSQQVRTMRLAGLRGLGVRHDV